MVESCEFSGDLRSAAAAREWGRSLFERCGAAPAIVDNAVAVLNELVVNAVVHGVPPIRVTIEVLPGDTYRVSVTDQGTTGPQPRLMQLPRVGASSGSALGLRIVERLATCWGVARDAGGTTVWFELHER